MLRIVGFIDKIGKNYQWIFNTSSPRIEVPLAEHKKRNQKRIKGLYPEKELIGEIVKRFSSEGELEKFVEKLKEEFDEKKKSCK